MGLNKFSWLLLLLVYQLFTFLISKAYCDHGLNVVSVNFLEAPLIVSSLTTTTFVFEVKDGRDACRNCSIRCKLDDHIDSDCEARKISYMGLHEGNHTFEVCSSTSGSQRIGCARYNWTVDTVPPTAYVTSATSFTSASNFSVDISFSELCTSRGGFRCISVNSCNLRVYGPGQVVTSSLKTLEPDLKFSLLVRLSSDVQYGRVVVVMDKSFCTDNAGNSFTRTTNSSFVVHFDRRSLLVNLRMHIPERLLDLNNTMRTVQATNNYENLKVYLYFSEPVLNSSAQILSSLSINQGLLLPTNGKRHGNRRFGYLVQNISEVAVVTINFESSSIISRLGTPFPPIAPVTFLYDDERPSVRLSTTSNMRTRERIIPVIVKFSHPVFDFNSSTLSISGGHLQSLHGINRSVYIVHIHADETLITVNIPENITNDVAGSRNLASNILHLRHYTIPVVSVVISTFTTATFALTSLAAGLLTVATASLQYTGGSSMRSSLISDPARNLFRTACHIQVFALSRWLAVTLPIEYYEFTRGLQWSIPYLNLPWETGNTQSIMVDSRPPGMAYSEFYKRSKSGTFKGVLSGDREFEKGTASIYGSPLTPMEYKSFFLVRPLSIALFLLDMLLYFFLYVTIYIMLNADYPYVQNQNIKPEVDYILDPHNLNGWRKFKRNMFWLAVIGGSLLLIRYIVLFILKCRRNSEDRKRYGALVFPRFEIFLIILALPCICQASAGLVLRGGGTLHVVIGISLLGGSLFLLLVLLLFLSWGITLGKSFQYKEVHQLQVSEKFYWYQEIVRVTLGPGKRGEWTWKNESNSVYLTMFGPLFEDLRGPPKYMLSQMSGGKHGERIIASDDEREDAEAPFIQKLFGILRIYYTLLESSKRAALGILAGAYSTNRSSRAPSLVLLCITSFQLFFLVLKKPFVKKKNQLVEILTVGSEVGIFAACLILTEKEFSAQGETRIGIFMLLLFLFGFVAQMINELYALYMQILRLSSTKGTFSSGLKTACIGLLLIVLPWNLLKKQLDDQFFASETSGYRCSSSDRNRSSGSRSSGDKDKRARMKQQRELAKASFSKDDDGMPKDPSSSQTGKDPSSGQTRKNRSSGDRDKQPRMKQQRELAKASFSKDDDGVPKDPSSSQTVKDPSSSQTRKSGDIWSGKKSESSSSQHSSVDFKTKTRKLYRDLEAISSR